MIHLGLRVFFDLKYFKSLEETHFRNRPADFLWMLLVGAAMMLPAAHLVPEPMLFLSNALAYMVMYGEGPRTAPRDRLPPRQLLD